MKNSHPSDDFAGGRSPNEGFRAAVPVLYVRLYRLDEHSQGRERSTPDRLPRDDVKPDFYLVQPGTAGRREMEGYLGMFGEPGVHVVSGVCRQIVQDDMNLSVWVPRDDGVHELEELLNAAPRVALTDHLAGDGVQRGEQVRRAVPHVVVGAFLGLGEVDRQHWLGAIQGLDLRLLAKAQHTAPHRRIEVEPDHIEHLRLEVRIGRQLEGA